MFMRRMAWKEIGDSTSSTLYGFFSIQERIFVLFLYHRLTSIVKYYLSY